MARPPGTPKSGGRVKGTPNKKTALLAELFEKNEFNVVENLINILPKLKPEKKADVLLALMSFIYPKPKAAEVKLDSSDADDRPKTIIYLPSNGYERNSNVTYGPDPFARNNKTPIKKSKS